MRSRSIRSAAGALALTFAFAALGGCKKSESSSTSGAAGTNGSPPGVTLNGGQVSVREEDGLTRYSDEGPESGTVFTKRSVVIRKAADQTSDVLARLGPNIGVNKKAHHGGYYLVDFPTGAPGEMKPGWLPQDEVTGTPSVATHNVPPVAPPTPPGGPVHIHK